MAMINESPILSNILNGSGGILQPHLSNRFAVRFNAYSYSYRSTFSQDCFDFLSMQVLGLKLDLKNNTVSFELEQPLNNYEFFLVMLKELADMPFVEIKVLDTPKNSGEEPVQLLVLERCKLKDHEFALHYAETGTAKHTLTFKFDFKLIRDKIICQIHDLETARNAVALSSDNSSQEVIQPEMPPV